MTDDAMTVTTASGAVRGIDDKGTRMWLGIPYAAPPVGSLRWRAPVAPTPWSGVRDVRTFGPAAPQPDLPVMPLGDSVAKSEDCLSLNVWASSSIPPGQTRPVMVWVHGGAYVLGASSQPLYDGRSLVESGEVVLVTVNYRLGAFGFLDLSSFSDDEHVFDSNLALRDVVAALEWVRDNIAAFGGDPEAVTLFGESAGGGIVTTLMTVPSAQGLFHRAIAQSSPATSVYDSVRGRRVAELFLDETGVALEEVHRLRELPTDEITRATFALFDHIPTTAPGTLAFAPAVDGELVPDYPVETFRRGQAHPIPLLIGTNKDEANLFKLMRSPLIPITGDAIRSMFDRIAVERPELSVPPEDEIYAAYDGVGDKARGLAVARDIGFRMPTVWLAEGHSRIAPVYLYRFDWATPFFRMVRIGATHATELSYLWGNLKGNKLDPTFMLGGRSTGEAVSARMQRRWLGFATAGTPDAGSGAPQWPPYETTRRHTLVIDDRDRLHEDLDGDIRMAWGDEVLSFP
ncbi:carboxylesterase/lipase family protein [Williamsia sp. CHRR-6]|uniref:carboxylesterase/lipase family protein n=1 Tax=Williamsia sp. CHRR-6 TaxID=2835871 RepID=UPI001BDA99F9|nr:carboxylesterase/lipase family protein [Williamsia sp. CHRR-6]MBT0568659.1 carboxylesterase/lipase family protein [Williamsia sp. CHRR-6]